MVSFFKKLKGEEETEQIEDKEEETEQVRLEAELKPKKRTKKIQIKSSEKPKEWLEPEGQLAVDVYQTDSYIVIQAPIAGIKKDALDIAVENDIVTIRGNRERPPETEEKNYFYQECYWGPFSREIILPDEGDVSRAEATMKEGVLTLKIPRIQRSKVKKIQIKE